MQLGEGEVLQLPFDVPHPEPVGERRIDVERLLGHGSSPVLWKEVHRAHVVQPVGELHQHYPDVLGHGDQHLADVLRLCLLLAVEGDLLQLGHAGHELADSGAKALLEVRDCQVGVLHGVVEDGGGQRVPVQLEVGEDPRHAERMLDEFLARQPVLVVVGTGGRVVGARQDLNVLRR